MLTASALWTVLALRYGTLPSTQGNLYFRWASYGDPDGPQSLDYYFWLLQSSRRTILVDTGFDPVVGARRGRTMLCAPLDALARARIEPESVDTVVVSHCHYDHVGNLRAFVNARFMVPERELEFWASPAANHEQFAEHVEPAEIGFIADAASQGRVETYAGGDELAPGIDAVDLRGHSAGQCGLLVQTPTRPVLLTSDAVHLYEELERKRPFGLVTDLTEMYEAYDRIEEICATTGAVLVPGHDPTVVARHPAMPGTDGHVITIS